MPRPIRLAAWLAVVASIAACQPMTPVFGPTTSPSAGPSPTPSIDVCALPSAIPSGTQAFLLDGYDAVPGLNSPETLSTRTVPIVLHLAAKPRVGEELDAVTVHFVLSRPTGDETLPPEVIKFPTTRVASVATERLGAQGPVSFGLPTQNLTAAIQAGPRPDRVTALLDFRFGSGASPIDASGGPFTVAIPLSLTDAPTPAVSGRLGACDVASPLPPNSPPRVVDLKSIQPTGGLAVPAGGSATATLSLMAPPGSAGTTIASYRVVYSWLTPDKKTHQTAPVVVPFSPMPVVQAAADTAYGPIRDVPVTFSERDFADARGQAGSILATVRFIDEFDFTVLDHNFQDLEVTVPITLP